MDFSIAGGNVLTQKETVENKSVLALANNRTMVGLRTFQSTFVK